MRKTVRSGVEHTQPMTGVITLQPSKSGQRRRGKVIKQRKRMSEKFTKEAWEYRLIITRLPCGTVRPLSKAIHGRKCTLPGFMRRGWGSNTILLPQYAGIGRQRA